MWRPTQAELELRRMALDESLRNPYSWQVEKLTGKVWRRNHLSGETRFIGYLDPHVDLSRLSHPGGIVEFLRAPTVWEAFVATTRRIWAAWR